MDDQNKPVGTGMGVPPATDMPASAPVSPTGMPSVPAVPVTPAPVGGESPVVPPPPVGEKPMEGGDMGTPPVGAPMEPDKPEEKPAV